MQWLWVVKLSLFMHFVKLCLIIKIVLVGRGPTTYSTCSCSIAEPHKGCTCADMLLITNQVQLKYL